MRYLRIMISFCGVLAACTSERDLPTDDPPGAHQLIKNALIVDGSGAPAFSGDVRFNRKGIIAVGDLKVLETDVVMFAEGLVLAPGFIDTHSHHDTGLDKSPQAVAAALAGRAVHAGFKIKFSGGYRTGLARR